MAEIGIMKKLTIGGSTYTIPEYNLPIASTSTLGGVKIGTGLSINSTTGVLSATGASFDETDPIFTASPAAGITQNDIDSWDAKVSDDKTWNSVTLNKTSSAGYSGYVPFLLDTTSTTASLRGMSDTPSSGRIAVYNSSNYLISTTPTATDNSTKVATTAFVKSAIPTNVSAFTNDSGYLTSYTETDPIFVASAAYGITSSDISNWNSKTSNTGTITKIQTSAGAHSTVNVSSGNVSFNVPTKTSHLTNDSGYLTSHQDISGKADKSSTVSNIAYDSTSRTLKKTINNTTSDVVDFGTAAFKLFTDSISNTSTNLPTSAAVASFVEGKGYLTSYTETDPVFAASAAAGITSTDISNWNAKSDTDEKLKTGDYSNNNSLTVYPILGVSSTTASTKGIDTTGLKYYIHNGTTSDLGLVELTLGNNIDAGTANNKFGILTMYGSSTHYTQISAGNLTADRTLTLPDKSGKIALISDIPTVPTKTSDLTNDSGFITSYTDEKVKVVACSQNTTYYPILATGTGTAARQIATNGMSFRESGGGVTLDLGLDSSHWGILSLGGESQYKTTISGLTITANRSLTLPDKSGTIALTSDIVSKSLTFTMDTTDTKKLKITYA